MAVWKLIVYIQIIVSATETSYKMASTLFQKCVLKELGFRPKPQILYILEDTIWFKFRRNVVQVRIK